MNISYLKFFNIIHLIFTNIFHTYIKYILKDTNKFKMIQRNRLIQYTLILVEKQ